MLTLETIGRIPREHFFKGKTIKEIARDLKPSRNTVSKVLRLERRRLSMSGRSSRPKLRRWTAEVDELLESNAAGLILPYLCYLAAKPEGRTDDASTEADWHADSFCLNSNASVATNQRLGSPLTPYR